MVELFGVEKRAAQEAAVTVNLVGSCTDRKKLPVTPGLRLRSIPHSDSTPRSREWLKQLQQADVRSAAASDLYSGDHWSVLRTLATDPSRGIRLWVASAGYGLVSPDDRLKPYSATFTAGHQDSVTTGRDCRSVVLQGWWAELASWAGPGLGPRTLTELAGENPRAAMVVAASEAYLLALEPDLRGARDALDRPDLLILCSVGAKFETWMPAHQPAVDSRLSSAVGGAAISLNARLARLIIEGRDHHGFDRAKVAAYLTGVLAGKPVPVRPQRIKLSDSEVRGFIIDLRVSMPNLSASVALRAFREAGWACEQTRFRQLFVATAAGIV